MDSVNYKTYQQVLNIVVNSGLQGNGKKLKQRKETDLAAKCEKAGKSKVTKPKKETPITKRRTKTGCLTCRRRKKKCDEDKVNGKCQACTRNFLECCWPEVAAIDSKLPTPAGSPVICPTSPAPVQAPATPQLSALPSPKSTYKRTPISDVSAKCSINSLLASPKSEYPSPVHSPVEKEEKIEKLSLDNETKFIITTFDSHKDLCQVE